MQTKLVKETIEGTLNEVEGWELRVNNFLNDKENE